MDKLQGECVVAPCGRILSSMSLITSNYCLKAERQRSHLFTWHKRGLHWRAVPDSNVYTMLPPPPVPTGHWLHCGLFNSAVYWWQATVSLPLYDPELGKPSFSWKDGERERRRRHHSLGRTVCFTCHRRVPYSVVRCTQVTGQDNLPAHIKSGSADKSVGARPEIAFDLWRNYRVFLQHWYAWLSVPRCLCMVNNNEAVRTQSRADRSDVTGGMMCVVAYLM